MLEIHSKRPRFQNFSKNSRHCREFFRSDSTYSKAFAPIENPEGRGKGERAYLSLPPSPFFFFQTPTKDDLCDHFKHNAIKTRGKIDSGEKPKQQLHVLLEKATFFSKLLRFTVVKGLVTNGSRLITRCFGCIFRSWLC